MIPKACLDTGVITLFFTNPVPPSIKGLLDRIESRSIEACVVSPVLVEAFSQLCRLEGGTSFAERAIVDLLNMYPIKLVSLNQSLIIKAGQLKCKHRNVLSLVDCMAVGHALNNKLDFHTTEKSLAQLFPRLKVVAHQF